MPKFSVVLLAAGGSSRFKDREKKQFADLDGRAVWLRSLELFAVREDIEKIVIVINPDDRELFERRYTGSVAFIGNTTVVEGGAERYDSVEKGILRCPASSDYIAIHDTVRPCLTKDMVDAVFGKAVQTGAAVLACRVNDTVKRTDKEHQVTETVPRDSLWLVQTPQVFRRQILLDAYAKRDKFKGNLTDDSQLVEAIGVKVTLVEGDMTNIKITSKPDLILANAILKSRPQPKSKQGFHPFSEEDMWR